MLKEHLTVAGVIVHYVGTQQVHVSRKRGHRAHGWPYQLHGGLRGAGDAAIVPRVRGPRAHGRPLSSVVAKPAEAGKVREVKTVTIESRASPTLALPSPLKLATLGMRNRKKNWSTQSAEKGGRTVTHRTRAITVDVATDARENCDPVTQPLEITISHEQHQC